MGRRANRMRSRRSRTESGLTRESAMASAAWHVGAACGSGPTTPNLFINLLYELIKARETQRWGHRCQRPTGVASAVSGSRSKLLVASAKSEEAPTSIRLPQESSKESREHLLGACWHWNSLELGVEKERRDFGGPVHQPHWWVARQEKKEVAHT